VECDGHEPCLVRLGEGDSAEEIATIARLRTDGARLLNMTSGGDGCAGTPEVRAKIAAALRGRKLSPEHRAHIAAGVQQRAATPEYRANVSAGVRAALTPDRRMQVSEQMRGNTWNRGRKHSAEVNKRKGQPGNQHLLGHVHSPETRALIGAKSRAARARKFWSTRKKES